MTQSSSKSTRWFKSYKSTDAHVCIGTAISLQSFHKASNLLLKWSLFLRRVPFIIYYICPDNAIDLFYYRFRGENENYIPNYNISMYTFSDRRIPRRSRTFVVPVFRARGGLALRQGRPVSRRLGRAKGAIPYPTTLRLRYLCPCVLSLHTSGDRGNSFEDFFKYRPMSISTNIWLQIHCRFYPRHIMIIIIIV